MHNAAKYLAEQLVSVLAQTTPLDRLIIVDDHSVDDSRNIARQVLSNAPWRYDVVAAPHRSRYVSDLHRIAENFAFGVQHIGTDVVAFADHDDVWYPWRLERQVNMLRASASLSMIASNADLIDEDGTRLSGNLFEAFKIPGVAWSGMSARDRLKYTIASPVATGAASCIVPARLSTRGHVPTGWLHDRWYSLDAASRDGLALDTEPVIQYRIHERQTVGLTQSRGTGSLLASAMTTKVGAEVAIRKAISETKLGLHSDDGVRSPLVFPCSLYARLSGRNRMRVASER